MTNVKNDIVRSAIWLMVLTILAKAFGLLREIALSYTFGTTSISDAYIVGTSFASVIFIATAGAFTTAYIPIGAGLDKEKLSKFTSNIFNIGSIIIIAVSVIFIIYTKPIIEIFAPGFKGETLENAIIISRFAVSSSVFLLFLNIGNGYLNLHNKFYVDSMQSVIANIVVVISFFISNGNAWFLGSFYWLSLLIPSIIVIYILKLEDFKYHFIVRPKDEKIKQVLKITGPIFIGLIAIQFNIMIDSAFASTLHEGVVSALKYANLLCSLITAILGGTIATVLYPKLSRYFNENNMLEIKSNINKVLKILTLVMLPVIEISIFKSDEIITIIFQRGAFDANSTNLTATAFSIYSMGLLSMVFCEVLNRMFFATQNSKIAAKCYVLGMVSNVFMDWLFIGKWGYKGLALATSISSIIMLVTLMIEYYKLYGDIGLKDILKTLMQGTISVGIMYIGLIVFSKLITFNITNVFGDIFTFSITVGLSLVLYLISLMLMKTPEIMELINMIKYKERF